MRNLIRSTKLRKNRYIFSITKSLTKYINGPKCLRLSQHYLGLHIAQLVFHFCLYIPCDTKCRTFLRMAQYYIYKESRIFSNIVILLFLVHQNYQRNRKFLLFLPVKEMFEKILNKYGSLDTSQEVCPVTLNIIGIVPLFLFLFFFSLFFLTH